jgi:hypothetical protein
MAILYKSSETTDRCVKEPSIAYQTLESTTETAMSKEWNPNIPFHGTQDDWWKHFHQIEEGNFTPLTIANQNFEIWRTKLLASRL